MIALGRVARPPPRFLASANQHHCLRRQPNMTIINPKFIEDANRLDAEAVELDRAREELKAARARLFREAEAVLVEVVYGHSRDGEPSEDRDIAYDGEFVEAVIAVKQARARITDLELREFEARAS